MDRDSIQRRDFPTGRKGYDPAAVDEHLRRVADEFERSVAPRPAPSLSSGTSEQVRAILEAAERSAADLRTKAEQEAGDEVARVRGAADGLLGRLDDLEHQLNGLLETLRASGEKLSAGLADLQQRVGGISAGEPARPQIEEPELTAPDDAGARLIALNMALTGTPREETARYLADHFAIADLETLLDDVYSRAGQ